MAACHARHVLFEVREKSPQKIVDGVGVRDKHDKVVVGEFVPQRVEPRAHSAEPLDATQRRLVSIPARDERAPTSGLRDGYVMELSE